MIMSYASAEEVEAGFRELGSDERKVCEALLSEAGVQIDAVAPYAKAEAKKVVSCRMVRRALASGSDSSVPIGATQGSISALGYAQSWTVNNGSTGELYLGSSDRKILGLGNRATLIGPLDEVTE